MKKLIALLFAMILVFVLVSCGEAKTEQTKAGGSNTTAAPVQTQKPTENTQKQSENTEKPDDPDSTDIDALMLGIGADHGTIYGNLDPATKAKLIEVAKKEGADISFGADGTMTVVSEDGTSIQHPDGTWTFKDKEGGEAQYGGEWPDNKYTRLVPKPSMKLTAAAVDDEGFSVAFTADVTVDQVRAYAAQVKAAGFNINVEETDQTVMGMVLYTFEAENAAGYRVTVSYAAGVSSLSIEEG